MALCGCCTGGSSNGCHVGWSESFARDRERWGRKSTSGSSKSADDLKKIEKRKKELQDAENDLKADPKDQKKIDKVEECKQKLKKAEGKTKSSEATSNAAQTGLYLFTRMILGESGFSRGTSTLTLPTGIVMGLVRQLLMAHDLCSYLSLALRNRRILSFGQHRLLIV